MLFHNESEIDENAHYFRSHPVLGTATRFLQDFRTLVNNNSDGWCYWRPPVKAAKRLMHMIDTAKKRRRLEQQTCYGRFPEFTMKDFEKTLIPIRSFCTRHHFAFPALRTS